LPQKFTKINFKFPLKNHSVGIADVFLCRGVISYSRMLNQNYEEAGKDDSEEYEHAVLLLDREPS